MLGNSDGGKQETPHKENPSIQKQGTPQNSSSLENDGEEGTRGHSNKPGEHSENGGNKGEQEAQVGLFRQGRGRLCGGTGLRSRAPGAHAVQLDGVSGSKAPMLNWSPLSSLHVSDGVN